MKQVLASIGLTLLVTVSAKSAATQQQTIDWSRTIVTGAAALPGDGPGGSTALQLRGAYAGSSFRLVSLDHPSVSAPGYVVTGDVRYDGVEGQGYLEMWSVFPNGDRFFSRTLAPSGPHGLLHGDSKWRRFELPFVLNGATRLTLPTRLEINIVLPGPGTVWLGPLRLEGLASSEAAGGAWNGRVGTLAGALGGLLGLVGGLIGVLAGRGRARRLVLSLIFGTVAIGVGLAVFGGVAALTSQPREGWYPLVLVGVLSAVVGLSVLPAVRRRYALDELRRIQARDA